MRTKKTIWMPDRIHSLQRSFHYDLSAGCTFWGKIVGITVFTIKLSFFEHKSLFVQRTLAAGILAKEMRGTKTLIQRADERSPDSGVATPQICTTDTVSF